MVLMKCGWQSVPRSSTSRAVARHARSSRSVIRDVRSRPTDDGLTLLLSQSPSATPMTLFIATDRSTWRWKFAPSDTTNALFMTMKRLGFDSTQLRVMLPSVLA